MSKVAITGNASGTGTLTIAAPNTNTDYTLTLPDESGTVLTSGGAIDVNASAPADSVAISSAGNVGIGNSSPSYALHVGNGTADKRSVFNPNSAYAIGVSNGASFAGWIGGSGSADTMVFSSSGGTERMRIDSAGRVTMPYQPLFMGYPSNNYSSGGMPTGVQAFTASYNNGGYFNSSNSRFTAPVAGWYLTTWGGLQLPATVTSLMVNGTRTYSGNHFAGSGISYITMTQTVLRYLNAGDYLNIEGWNGGGYYNSWYLWSVALLA